MFFFSYSRTLQWADKAIAYGIEHNEDKGRFCGAVPKILEPRIDLRYVCQKKYEFRYLCELKRDSEDGKDIDRRNPVLLDVKTADNLPRDLVQCPEGHITHVSLAYDAYTACWTNDGKDIDFLAQYPTFPTRPLPSFACTGGLEDVPYTLVCDHRHDCPDSSDEEFCVFPRCSGSDFLQCSTTSQVKTLSRSTL